MPDEASPKFRIWWIPQIPGKSFMVNVFSIGMTTREMTSTMRSIGDAMPDDAARLKAIEEAHADWRPDIADHVAWLLAQLAAREAEVAQLRAENYWSLIEHFQDLIPTGGEIGREELLATLESRAVHRPQSTLRAALRTVAEALILAKEYVLAVNKMMPDSIDEGVVSDIDAALALDAVQEVREAP